MTHEPGISIPTRTVVYRYGLLSPTSGAELVADQISRAHKYYNALIEIELDRRAAVRTIMSAHDTTQIHATRVAVLADQLGVARAGLRGRKGEALAEARAEVRTIAAELKMARADLKSAKIALRGDTAISAAIAAVNESHHQRARDARAACEVYWGTYLLIEQAADAARKAVVDPRFRRWNGGAGAVGVQIQGGMPASDLIGGDDSRIRITTSPAPIPGRGGKPRQRLLLRVGSDGRAPVWAEWPVILHRPLPDDARIKWAKVVAERVASHLRWSLHLTLEVPGPLAQSPVAGGVAAVDLRWSRVTTAEGEDQIRVAGWCDSDGGGAEIYLDRGVAGQLAKASDLRSIRDQNFNTALTALASWLRAQDTLPDEMRERAERISTWRSAGRLAALILWWREHRFSGDVEAFTLAEEWRSHDKHLWEWEANSRRKAIARRRDGYRVFAAHLARTYDTLVIERLDLRALAAVPAPESERENIPIGRAQRVEAAPSELRAACVHAFAAAGKAVVTVPPSGPATSLLAAWREGSSVEAQPVTARVSRFKRLRAAGTGDIHDETAK